MAQPYRLAILVSLLLAALRMYEFTSQDFAIGSAFGALANTSKSNVLPFP